MKTTTGFSSAYLFASSGNCQGRRQNTKSLNKSSESRSPSEGLRLSWFNAVDVAGMKRERTLSERVYARLHRRRKRGGFKQSHKRLFLCNRISATPAQKVPDRSCIPSRLKAQRYQWGPVEWPTHLVQFPSQRHDDIRWRSLYARSQGFIQHLVANRTSPRLSA